MSDRSKIRRRNLRRGLGATGACVAAVAGFPALAADATVDTAADAGGNTITPVVVTARKPGVRALTETVQNTAQSINVLPQELLQQQAVTNLQDALKNVPGVTLNSGEGGAHGDTINLRGFPAADDFFLDGLRDTGFYTRDSFDLDSVEVYKGPASTLFGRGSTGGVVNQVSKAPLLHPLDAAVLTLGTNNEVRATTDDNVVINDSTAFRIASMGQYSNVADRDFVLNRRWGVAPSIAFGIGGPTTLTVNYLHQEENDIPDYGIPFVGTRPAPVPRNFYYGLPSDDRFKTRVDVGTVKFEHDFNNSVSVSEAFRAGNYYFDSRETAPHYDPGNVIAPPTDSTPLDQILIYRDRPSVEGTVSTVMSDTQLNWRFGTGPLKHTVIFGIEADREDASLIRYTNQISSGLTVAPGTIGPTSLLFPNPFEAVTHQTTVRQRPVTKTDTLAGYFEDSIELGDHWNLVGAIRVDQFHANFVQPLGTATHFDHTDVIPSPRAALVYKPTDAASFYVSYGTSFDPSAENLSLSATNANLPPEKDQTFEAGGKVVVLGGKLSLTGAVFDTEMTNARVADPDNATLQTLAGDLRVDGVEFGAQGYITDKWEVVAGYTWLDGRTVRSTAAANVGKPLQNTAPNQLNIWTVYDFTDRLKVGTGANYLDRRFADQAGTVTVPAYVTWDAMISYQLTHNLNVQLNATNLTDAYYYTNSYDTSPTENHVIPGPGRTVTLALAYAY